MADIRTRILDTEGSVVLILLVEYDSHQVVELTDGSVYQRIGDSDRRLSPDEVVHLRYDKGEVSYESEVVSDSSFDELDPTLVTAYCDAIRNERDLQHDRSEEDILVQRRLGVIVDRRFRPRNSAIWLFARDPILRFPGCKIRFIRYEGTEEQTGAELNVIRDVVIEGPVPVLIRDAAQAVFSQLREYRALQPDGTFALMPEYPPDCVREAIVNACVHRSYSMRQSNVFIRMFDNRLEVESPGGFIPPVTAETIYEHHSPRNPIMMDGLMYLRFVRCANEGTRRMQHLMQKLGLPAPVFQETKKGPIAKVTVTLHNNIEHRRVWVDRELSGLVGEQLARAMTEDEKRVLNYLAEFTRINVSEALRITKAKKWHAARKIMNGLLEKGVVVEVKVRERDPNAHFLLAGPWQGANGTRESRAPLDKNGR